MLRNPLLTFSIILALAACAPAAGRRRLSTQSPPRSGPTLRSILKVEPASLARKPLEGSGISIDHATSLFNATPDQLDGQEVARPYLAEALPALHTDTRRGRPRWTDGDNLAAASKRHLARRHDATLLTADDFVFAWRIYNTPELGVAGSRPNSLMEDARAPDPRTLMIRWNSLYPGTGDGAHHSPEGLDRLGYHTNPRLASV